MCLHKGFQELVPRLGNSYDKNHSITGSVLGPPVFGNFHLAIISGCLLEGLYALCKEL